MQGVDQPQRRKYKHRLRTNPLLETLPWIRNSGGFRVLYGYSVYSDYLQVTCGHLRPLSP